MKTPHYLLYGTLAFLGPGLFGALMGPGTHALTPWEGMMLILVPSGLAWVVFGPLCMAVNRWSLPRTAKLCLKAMAPGSAWLGMASLGFILGGGWGWAFLSLMTAHFVMMGRFVFLGRTFGPSALRLSVLWLLGLDGAALLIVGGFVWL